MVNSGERVLGRIAEGKIIRSADGSRHYLRRRVQCRSESFWGTIDIDFPLSIGGTLTTDWGTVGPKSEEDLKEIRKILLTP